jgi:hypothetical protein
MYTIIQTSWKKIEADLVSIAQTYYNLKQVWRQSIMETKLYDKTICFTIRMKLLRNNPLKLEEIEDLYDKRVICLLQP